MIAEIKKYIEDFGNRLIKNIRSNYLKDNRKASGKFGNDLNYTIIEQEKGYDLIIKSSSYSQAMLYGRKPGGYPPIQAIKDWMAFKNIKPDDPNISQNELAYMIRNKIASKGTLAPNKHNDGKLVEKSFTDDMRSELVKNVISFTIKKNMNKNV